MEQPPCAITGCGYSCHKEPFAIGQTLKTHLIRFQSEGSCLLTLNGSLHEIKAGGLLLLAPGDSYTLQNRPLSSPTDKTLSCDYFFYCVGERLDEWRRSRSPRILHIGMDDPFLNILKNILYEKRKLKDSDEEMQYHLMMLLLLSIRRFRQNGATAHPKAYLPYRMKHYIEGHATERLTLKQIASSAGLGISRASKLFKETFGQSVIDYAIDVKLNIARERLLYDNGSLEEIACECGFGSYIYFSPMFSLRFGLTPKAYRNRNQIRI